MKKLLVIDGNSILNRAFYGISPLSSPDGTPTNAVFGFINTVKKYMDQLVPDYMACAFDLKTPTFRHEKYEAYKAGRRPMPEDLAVQFPIAKQILAAMGIPCVELARYEADDILGTLSRIASNKEVHSYLLTGDRDSLQLIDKWTTVILQKKGEDVFFDESVFKNTYGILPQEYVDVKALMGDSSDNIPGVSGIGEKTALKLIAEYHSLQRLYDELGSSDLTDKTKTKLMDGKASAWFSKDLATICRTAPGLDDIEPYLYKGIRKGELRIWFDKLNLKSMIDKFHLENDTLLANEPSFHNDSPVELLRDFLPSRERPVAVSFTLQDQRASVCLFDGMHCYEGVLEPEAFSDLLSRSSYVVYDYKSICKTLMEIGIKDPPLCLSDVMLADYLENPGENV